MPKLYNEKIVSDLQKAVNEERYSKRSIKDFDSISKIYVGGVEIDLIEMNGMKSVLLKPDETTDKNYMIKWKSYAPGKFLAKDWKKDKRDFIGYTYYYIFDYVVTDSLGEDHSMKALVRSLYEMNTNELKDVELNDLVAEYGDIKVTDAEGSSFFAIIKIWNENDPMGLCSRNMFGSLETNSSEAYSAIIEEAFEEDFTEPIQDEPMTSPLF